MNGRGITPASVYLLIDVQVLVEWVWLPDLVVLVTRLTFVCA